MLAVCVHAGSETEGSDNEASSSSNSGSGSGSGSNTPVMMLPGQDAAMQLERGIEQLAQAEKVAGKVRAGGRTCAMAHVPVQCLPAQPRRAS